MIGEVIIPVNKLSVYSLIPTVNLIVPSVDSIIK
jgi:hypothetical protein